MVTNSVFIKKKYKKKKTKSAKKKIKRKVQKWIRATDDGNDHKNRDVERTRKNHFNLDSLSLYAKQNSEWRWHNASTIVFILSHAHWMVSFQQEEKLKRITNDQILWIRCCGIQNRSNYETKETNNIIKQKWNEWIHRIHSKFTK